MDLRQRLFLIWLLFLFAMVAGTLASGPAAMADPPAWPYMPWVDGPFEPLEVGELGAGGE